jgi:hypothetical protein
MVIICILIVPVFLFVIGITAKPIGYGPPSGYEIREGFADPYDRVPIYDPLVEAAKFLFGVSLLFGIFGSIGIAMKYLD